MEFKQYWKQIIQNDKELMPKVPDFHNWEYLSDGMFAELPAFKHMCEERDLNKQMRTLMNKQLKIKR